MTQEEFNNEMLKYSYYTPCIEDWQKSIESKLKHNLDSDVYVSVREIERKIKHNLDSEVHVRVFDFCVFIYSKIYITHLYQAFESIEDYYDLTIEPWISLGRRKCIKIRFRIEKSN